MANETPWSSLTTAVVGLAAVVVSPLSAVFAPSSFFEASAGKSASFNCSEELSTSATGASSSTVAAAVNMVMKVITRFITRRATALPEESS